MEPKEHDMPAIDGRPIRVEQAMLTEQKNLGTIVDYVTALSITLGNDENYRPNLLQLQRMSNFITEPAPGLGSQRWANCFYWGGILGITAGDRIMGPEWANRLYVAVNKQLYDVREAAALSQIYPQTLPNDFPADLKNTQHSTNASNILLNALQEATGIFPPESRQLIGEWASQLSEDETEQFFITAGFNLIFDIAMVEAKSRAKVTE